MRRIYRSSRSAHPAWINRIVSTAACAEVGEQTSGLCQRQQPPDCACLFTPVPGAAYRSRNARPRTAAKYAVPLRF